MQLVKFLKDASSQAAQLSRETLDLKTSSQLRRLSEQLRQQSVDRERQIAKQPVTD